MAGSLPTEEGAPQGGVISPLLMNVALHGMEAAAGVRYHLTGTRAGKTMPDCPVLIRYADDLLALCHSREQAEQVKARLAEWLAPRGLVFNEDKTQITHLDQGVDFLGFTIRRYPNGKLLTKPSNDALRRIRKRLSAEVKALRGANADAVIAKLNPIITGWAAYYRIGVSKRAFGALDAHVWRLVYKWARFSHPNKSTRWVIARYFGMFNPSRRDKWVFGSRDTGFYLRKFAWTPIVRHRMVAGTASPDDPALTDYWAPAASPQPTPAGRDHAAAPASPARPLPALPRAAAARRPRATKPTRVGTVAHGHPQGDPQTRGHRRGAQARRTNASQPVSYTPTATAAAPAAATGQHFCPPASLQGLLEPVARKAGTAGSEGAPAQQCAGATRRDLVRHHQTPSHPPRHLHLRPRPHRSRSAPSSTAGTSAATRSSGPNQPTRSSTRSTANVNPLTRTDH